MMSRKAVSVNRGLNTQISFFFLYLLCFVEVNDECKDAPLEFGVKRSENMPPVTSLDTIMQYLSLSLVLSTL